MLMGLEEGERVVECEPAALRQSKEVRKRNAKDLKGKISKMQMESQEVNLTHFTILPGTTKTW